MPQTKLIVGLGNPGQKYQKTRHNFGCMAVESLAKKWDVRFNQCRYAKALTGHVQEGDLKVILALPETYMNHSGIAVQAIIGFDKIALEDIIIVVDDLHLDFGQIRLRLKGSDAGHNGLKSISACLNSSDYARLKLGIGKPPMVKYQADYVLENFSKEEYQHIGIIIEKAENCLHLWLNGSYQEAMSKFNRS